MNHTRQRTVHHNRHICAGRTLFELERIHTCPSDMALLSGSCGSCTQDDGADLDVSDDCSWQALT